MRILNISALPVWPMKGGGGMPSLSETLDGHVREGHEITVIIPQYYLFGAELGQVEVPQNPPYEVFVAKCPWLVPLKKARLLCARFGPGGEPIYPARWVLNMLTFLLLTVSLVW